KQARPKCGRNVSDVARALGLVLDDADAPRQRASAANDSNYSPVVGADFFRVCRDTERTAHLTHIAGYAFGRGMDQAGTTEICLGWNAHNDPPLEESKVSATVASLARTHRRNHPAAEVPDTPL